MQILSIFSDKLNLEDISLCGWQFANLIEKENTLAGHQGYPLTFAHIIYRFENNDGSIDYYNCKSESIIHLLCYLYIPTMGKKTKTNKEERGEKKKRAVRIRPKSMEEFGTAFKKMPN